MLYAALFCAALASADDGAEISSFIISIISCFLNVKLDSMQLLCAVLTRDEKLFIECDLLELWTGAFEQHEVPRTGCWGDAC